MSDTETLPSTEAPPRRRRRRGLTFLRMLVIAIVLLFGVPLLTFVVAPGWPLAGTLVGVLVVLAAIATLVLGMMRGHGKRGSDRWSIAGDATLGIVWIVFTWSV